MFVLYERVINYIKGRPMKVFTRHEIEARRLPKDDAQEQAANILRSWLTELYKGQKAATLSAAVLIGSSARGEATITSDMDVLLFLEDGHMFEEGLKELSSVLSGLQNSIRHELFVPLEFHAVLKSQMEPGQKRYDKQFLRHAVWALDWGGLLCGRQEEVKHFHELAPSLELATALTYIDRKVAKAHTALCTLGGLGEDEMVRLLADLVGSPFHALRRAFTLTGTPYVDNKSGLINSLRDIGDEMTEENLRFLRKLADSYGDYVTGVRSSLVTQSDPFVYYGIYRVAEEFFSAMRRIREIAVSTEV